MPALSESRPWGNSSIDARCGRSKRTGVGDFLASYDGHHLASPEATPSQGNLTLGVSSHRSTLGPASPGVWRLGLEIPSYGGTHQKRHLHAKLRAKWRDSSRSTGKFLKANKSWINATVNIEFVFIYSNWNIILYIFILYYTYFMLFYYFMLFHYFVDFS